MVKLYCCCCCWEFAADLADAVAPFLPFLMAMNAAKQPIIIISLKYIHQ